MVTYQELDKLKAELDSYRPLSPELMELIKIRDTSVKIGNLQTRL